MEHKIVDEQEKIKKLGDGSKSFLDTLETGYKNGDLSKEDYEELRSIVIEEGSKESDVEKRQQDILKAIETVGEYSEIPTSSAAGLLMKDYGDLLEGKNNLNLGPKLMNRMKSLTGTLKSGGSILTLVGTTVGYYDDVNNDKTPGQAIAHNGASLLASGGAALGVVLAASGPAGWLAAGVSTGVGIAFKAAYDNNFLGLQTGLDWTGEKIDDGLDWAGEKISDGWQWYKGQVKENWKMQTEMAGEAVNWAGGRLDDAQEQLGNARDWAGDQLDNAVDGMRETGERVRDGVQNAADTAVDFANDVGDAVSGGLDAINPFS